METGSGDTPSPPPRYSSPSSVLHALKGLGPAPVASVDTVDRVLALPVATATLVTMETTEATMPTGTKMEAPCVPTQTTSTVMTIEMSLVASDNRDMESLGQVASDSGAVTGDVIPVGDTSSTVTVSGVNSVAPVPTAATVNGTLVTSSSRDRMMSSPVALPTETAMKPLPVPPMSPTVVVVAPSPDSPPEKTSPPTPRGTEPHDLPSSQPPQDLGSQSSLGTTARKAPPAPDTLSYLDSVSLMSGTCESLTGPGFPDDVSSVGSDSEINGSACRKTDRFGFLGGSQYSGETENSIPANVSRLRELKWVDMISRWDKWLLRRFQKVKLRCRKGIPSSLRAVAWQLLSNSKKLLDENPGKFQELERQPGDPKWLDIIEKDLHRQFPFHEMFMGQGAYGQQDLYRILKAYTIYRPEEGYCQAQAPVGAVLLMQMPAEQAFWCLVQICEKYLPGYYSAGLEAIQLDGEIFFAFLRRASPLAYRHLKKYKIDPILYMTEWFMCIFSRTLPWASVMRVWDMFFCEGVKIIFRVGLVLLRNTLGSVDKLRSCQGMYETMEKLRNLPVEAMEEDYLVHEVINLPVTEALIERENAIQLKKWRETRGELQYKPSRRLHGSRAIHEEYRRRNQSLSASSRSISSLSLSSLKQRVTQGSISGPSSSPAHSAGPSAMSVAPPPVPPAAQSQVVVSEGLHPALPSPTGNNMPLGGPKKIGGGGSSSKEEKRKEKEREKQERLEKEKQKQERERERREEKEREKQEKEREKKLQKERAKEEARLKKDRKLSLRKKESKTASRPPSEEGKDGEAPEASVLQDTYF